MRVLTTRADALTAGGLQCANATLLQHAVQRLLRTGITARTRQVLVIMLLRHISSCGGRLPAEAAGNRAAVIMFPIGSQVNSKESKDSEYYTGTVVFLTWAIALSQFHTVYGLMWVAKDLKC